MHLNIISIRGNVLPRKKTPPEAHLILDKEATLGDKKWSREMPLPSLHFLSSHPTGPFTNDV